MFASYETSRSKYFGRTSTNMYLQFKWDTMNYANHRFNVETAKPRLDNSPPLTYAHMYIRPKKLQLELERCSTIQRNNKCLMERLATIQQQGAWIDNKNYHEIKSLNTWKRQQEMIQLAYNNQDMIRRILDVHAEFNRSKLEDQYVLNQKYKANILKYASDWRELQKNMKRVRMQLHNKVYRMRTGTYRPGRRRKKERWAAEKEAFEAAKAERAAREAAEAEVQERMAKQKRIQAIKERKRAMKKLMEASEKWRSAREERLRLVDERKHEEEEKAAMKRKRAKEKEKKMREMTRQEVEVWKKKLMEQRAEEALRKQKELEVKHQEANRRIKARLERAKIKKSMPVSEKKQKEKPFPGAKKGKRKPSPKGKPLLEAKDAPTETSSDVSKEDRKGEATLNVLKTEVTLGDLQRKGTLGDLKDEVTETPADATVSKVVKSLPTFDKEAEEEEPKLESKKFPRGTKKRIRRPKILEAIIKVRTELSEQKGKKSSKDKELGEKSSSSGSRESLPETLEDKETEEIKAKPTESEGFEYKGETGEIVRLLMKEILQVMSDKEEMTESEITSEKEDEKSKTEVSEETEDTSKKQFLEEADKTSMDSPDDIKDLKEYSELKTLKSEQEDSLKEQGFSDYTPKLGEDKETRDQEKKTTAHDKLVSEQEVQSGKPEEIEEVSEQEVKSDKPEEVEGSMKDLKSLEDSDVKTPEYSVEQETLESEEDSPKEDFESDVSEVSSYISDKSGETSESDEVPIEDQVLFFEDEAEDVSEETKENSKDKSEEAREAVKDESEDTKQTVKEESEETIKDESKEIKETVKDSNAGSSETSVELRASVTEESAEKDDFDGDASEVSSYISDRYEESSESEETPTEELVVSDDDAKADDSEEVKEASKDLDVKISESSELKISKSKEKPIEKEESDASEVSSYISDTDETSEGEFRSEDEPIVSEDETFEKVGISEQKETKDDGVAVPEDDAVKEIDKSEKVESEDADVVSEDEPTNEAGKSEETELEDDDMKK